MRLAALAACFALTILPANAAQTIADQAHDAYAIFAGSMSQRDFLTSGYGRAALAGIDGRWVRLEGPDEKSGIETYGDQTTKTCASQNALLVTTLNPWEIEVRTVRETNALRFTYSLMAGATYTEHTDIISYLTSLGLGPDNTRATDAQRAIALSLVNVAVQIFHPSDDILVLTRDRGYPVVMARCPPA